MIRPPRSANGQRLVLLLLLACLAACRSDDSQTQLVNRLDGLFTHMGRKSVVSLKIGGEDLGKGLLLSDGKRVITAASNFAGQNAAAAFTISNATGDSRVGRLEFSDPQSDLALCQVSGTLNPLPGELPDAEPSGRLGEGNEVYIFTSDEELGLRPVTTHTLQYRETRLGELLRLSKDVAPTDRGGPLFSREGLVLGLVISRRAAREKATGALVQPLPAIHEFLNRTSNP